MDNEIKFEVQLNESQYEKFREWKEAHKIIYGKYGNFSYHFYPTEMDLYVEITSKLSEQSISFLICNICI